MSKPLRVSWSGLRVWEECKQRSYLHREGKKAKVTNIRNFFAGVVVDRIMREWLDNPLIRHADTGALVRSSIVTMESSEKSKGNMVRWRDADDRRQVENFCIELITRLEPILEEHVVPYSYEHGKWFKIPMQIRDQREQLRDIVLTGEMDLLVQNDGPIVWDLKGTADDQYWRKVVGQLTFYDVALWASTGVRTRAVGLIQPMCAERVMAWQVTDEARSNLLARVVRYAHSAWAEEKDCTDDTSVCHWCDVRHACARFKTDNFGTFADAMRAAAGETT